MMQAQAHAYAFSCFLYFQQMAKMSKNNAEKQYYQEQQQIAGCMVHGPHGIAPAGYPPIVMPPVNTKQGLPQIPPMLNQYPLMHQQSQCGRASHPENEEQQRPEKLQYQNTFGGLANSRFKNDPCDTDEPAPVFKTSDKCPPVKKFYESDDYMPNTTGDKDRKKRKMNLKALIYEDDEI